MVKDAIRLRSLTLLVVLGAAMLLAPSLLFPYGRDQGVFTDVAEVILRGGMPYRDVWEIKPPGVYYLYAGVVALFGPGYPRAEWVIAAIRALDLAIQFAVALLLFRVGRGIVGDRSACLGALWYAALYLRGGYWSMGQAEGFANLPVLLSISAGLAATSRRQPAGVLLAGCLAGAAALLKFTAALPCVVILLWVLLVDAPGRQHLSRHVLLLAAGLALPLLGAVLYLRAHGAWEAYLEIQRGFVIPYSRLTYGGLSIWLRGLRGTWTFLIEESLPCALAIIGAVALARDAGREARAPLVLWLLATFVAVWAQGKFFRYHWIACLPPLALLAGRGSEWASGRVGEWATLPRVLAPMTTASRRCPPRVLAPWIGLPIGLALVVGWALVGEWPEYRDGWRVATGALSRQAYWRRFGRPFGGDYSFLADVWVGETIRAATAPGDTVFIWGFEPLVHVLSGRHSPTRFHFAVPVVSPWAPEAWRGELLRDLRARPPTLFLVLRNDAIPWASGRSDDSRAQLERFPELARFLTAGYVREREIEDFTIWRRRARSAPHGAGSGVSDARR